LEAVIKVDGSLATGNIYDEVKDIHNHRARLMPPEGGEKSGQK
jgi:hypothetical protein|tara:strand:- start:2320 stop:2448 length:129 start_codon:yes stop_codon:yes gene_type:complete